MFAVIIKHQRPHAHFVLQHKVNVLRGGVSELVLDTRNLKVSAATVGGKEAEFSFGEPHKVGDMELRLKWAARRLSSALGSLTRWGMLYCIVCSIIGAIEQRPPD